MTYLIFGCPASGGISTTRQTAEDALQKALIYEADGFKKVIIRRPNVRAELAREIASGPLLAKMSLVQKVDEYQRHAQECRDLAAKMPSIEHRDQLLEMARIWEEMAAEREGFVTEHPQFEVPRGPRR